MKAVGWLENGEIRWLGDRKPADDITLFVETPVEPETRDPIGYTLEPIYSPPRGSIVTQAFIMCHSCGGAVVVRAVRARPGPRYNVVCLKCAEHLNFTNLVKGNQ